MGNDNRPLGGVVTLHTALREGAPCKYCGKPQPWDGMEPCPGSLDDLLDRFESEVARQALTDFSVRSVELIAARSRLREYLSERTLTEEEARILDVAGGRYLAKNYPAIATKLASLSEPQ